MQIYKDMNVGTAKIKKEDMKEIPHHMIDIVSPKERFSVSSYKKMAEECIEKILKEGHVPIIVGGTGLYIDALIYEIEFEDQNIDETFRENLNKKAEEEGLSVLYEMAKKIDPVAMEKISENDKKRIIRVLEIYEKTGCTKTEQEINSRKSDTKYDYKLFGVTLERAELYERINKRVDEMVENGLIDEVRNILKKYESPKTAMQGIRV